MKFVSVRELRNQTSLIQRTVEEENVTLTSHGRPFALVIGLRERDDPAEMERLVRQARAQAAVSRIRARARHEGRDRQGETGIATEIAAARRARAPR